MARTGIISVTGHTASATPAATGAAARLHPDELVIRWGNLPRDIHVTLYIPQVDVDEVLRYAAFVLAPVLAAGRQLFF